MKLNRKLVLVLALVLSVAMATGGTLAFLTDRDTVENTFTMGNVDIEVEEEYEQGSPLLPGVEVEKKAGVKNVHPTNEAWVWMTVSVPAELEDAIVPVWLEGYEGTKIDTPVHEGYVSYVVKHPYKLLPGTSTPDFLQGVTLTDMVDFQDGKYVVVENGVIVGELASVDDLKVIVDGFAMQPDGFDTVDAAYEAYTDQWSGLNGGSSGVTGGEGDGDEDPNHICWEGASDTSWYNETDTEFVLTTPEQLAGLADLVDGGNTFEGKTVKLGSNICLGCERTYAEDNKPKFNPIGHSQNGKSFKGTFNGQDYAISNMYMQSNLDDKNGGWLYEGEYYALFAYTEGAVIKNLTMEGAYISSGRNEGACVAGNANNTTFENISINDATVIIYNNSGAAVAAECYGTCTFTNVNVDSDTVVGPLWGTYDSRNGGVIGMVKSDSSITFNNVNVACKLDAINDVAANYQYWLYRYSGMLIGQVDGVNGVADPTGYVTCNNVTVTYGPWVNFHYCEDADLGAGSYNGPGEYKFARVEAGTGTDGIDLSQCNHNEDESHNVLIPFDQLFGGGQGVKGLESYPGVTVKYPN
ncbi:MAG: hypothetical protein E7319_03475 [Clostridiales bacterium]|nr:hypothetical protein [Clostridiales bacterium]